MSCLTHPDGLVSALTEPSPRRQEPTGAQRRSRRNELFRLLREGNNSLFRNPLSVREIAVLFGCSKRLVELGIAEAKAVRLAVREATADEG